MVSKDESTDHVDVDTIDTYLPDYIDLSVTVSRLAQELKGSFSNRMANVCESYVTRRLKTKFRLIANSSKRVNGHSSVLLSKFGELLKGFEFNSKKPYHSVFNGKYFIKDGSNRGHIILHFPAFVPNQTLTSPKEATHFKLYNELIVLSDYSFDKKKGYSALSKSIHGKKSEFCSSMLPIIKIPTGAITSQLSVNNGMGVPDDSGLLLVMGIHFYQYFEGKYKPLQKESALDIVKVY